MALFCLETFFEAGDEEEVMKLDISLVFSLYTVATEIGVIHMYIHRVTTGFFALRAL